MIQIKSCNVTVMVSDLNKALDFYVDTLGFTLKNRFGDHWADIEGPGINIGLHPTEKQIDKGANMQIAIGVSDLEEAIEELKKTGVQFEINNDDQLKLASFTDPDQNALYLVQPSW